MNGPTAESLDCLRRGCFGMHRRATALALIAGMLASTSLTCAARAADAVAHPSSSPPNLIIHAPGAVAFWVVFSSDAPVLGPPRTINPADPLRDDEIMVDVLPPGMAPYAKLRIVEKTKQPVDFVITGLIDTIKIDEIVVCGRLDGDIEAKIAAGAKRLSLNRFTLRREGANCS